MARWADSNKMRTSVGSTGHQLGKIGRSFFWLPDGANKPSQGVLVKLKLLNVDLDKRRISFEVTVDPKLDSGSGKKKDTVTVYVGQFIDVCGLRFKISHINHVGSVHVNLPGEDTLKDGWWK